MEPTNDPGNVAQFLGMDVDGFGFLVTHATVVGSFDEEMSEFRNPLTQPNTGILVERAPDEMLSCISKLTAEARGSALVGNIFGRDECNVVLAPKEILSLHYRNN